MYAVYEELLSCWGGLGQARGKSTDRERAARTRPHALGQAVLNLDLAQSHRVQCSTKKFGVLCAPVCWGQRHISDFTRGGSYLWERTHGSRAAMGEARRQGVEGHKKGGRGAQASFARQVAQRADYSDHLQYKRCISAPLRSG